MGSPNVTKKWARAALSHPAFTGVSRVHLGGLIEELVGPWQAWRESALHQRRGGKRRRAAGAGRKHELVFTDRVLVALVHLRTQLPHAALAELYGVGRTTVTEAIGEIRPLLADRSVRRRRSRRKTPRSVTSTPGVSNGARQSAARICVEHANAEHKQWRPLQRFLGRREHHPVTHRAIAGLVSDRAAQRPTRRKPSTELVPVSPMTC